MATYNKHLENLSLEEIEKVSERFLMGWHDTYGDGLGFRVKGLNRRRAEYGLEPLTKEWSLQYRIDYVRRNFTQAEICGAISRYMSDHRMADQRWDGIELFGCRFGRDYAKAFRELMGSSAYRKAAEESRVAKLVETQVQEYGGVGVGGMAAHEKMQQTVRERYGVDNVMQADSVKQSLAEVNKHRFGGASPFSSEAIRKKAAYNRWKFAQAEMKELAGRDARYSGMLVSKYEAVVFSELVGKFGRDDVFYAYGMHPYDARYPYACDFYVKSMDLFIELNLDYSHGGHWYDANSADDVNRRNQLLASGKPRNVKAIGIWCETDLAKRQRAKDSGIRYLVFWDGSVSHFDHKPIPNLSDFYRWMYEYDCDYDRFVTDFPANTY